MNRFLKRQIGLNLVYSGLLSAILSSCATILLPKKQNVTIETEKQDATIFINNRKVGTGEVQVSLNKNIEFYYLSTKSEDKRVNDYIISPYQRHWFFYPSVLLGSPLLFPAMIDFGASNTFVFPKKVIIPYKLDMPKRLTGQRELFVDKVQTNDLIISKQFIQPNQGERILFEIEDEVVKTLETDEIETKEEDLFYDPNADTKEKNELVDLQFRALDFLSGADFFDTTFQIGGTSEKTLYVECHVKKVVISYLVNGFKNQLSKPGTYYDMSLYPLVLGMKSKWYFKDKYDNRLDSIEISSVSSHSFVQVLSDVVSSAFDHSFIDFMNHQKTQELLNKNISSTLSTTAPLILNGKRQNQWNSLEDITKSTVHIESDIGTSSGYFISMDGHILTSMSIIQPNSKDIKVLMHDGKEYKATIERYHQGENLAVLKCGDCQNGHTLDMSAPAIVQIGQPAFVIGSPLTKELNNTVLHGVVSAQRRIQNMDFIQINIGLSPGTSGAPLILKQNDKYYLAGMTIAKLGGKNVESLGFAISNQHIINTLKLQY